MWPSSHLSRTTSARQHRRRFLGSSGDRSEAACCNAVLPGAACRKLFHDVRRTTAEVRRRQTRALLLSAAVAQRDSQPLGLTPAIGITLEQSRTRLVA